MHVIFRLECEIMAETGNRLTHTELMLAEDLG